MGGWERGTGRKRQGKGGKREEGGATVCTTLLGQFHRFHLRCKYVAN